MHGLTRQGRALLTLAVSSDALVDGWAQQSPGVLQQVENSSQSRLKVEPQEFGSESRLERAFRELTSNLEMESPCIT